MANKVSLSLVRSPLTAPVLDGAVAIDGITPEIHEANSVNRNSREMLDGAYDVAEMSLATYFKAREDGLDFTGLPIFTGRRFVHSGIHTRPGAGIDSPARLAGRRVCVPQYWMTSSVWHRVLLAQEYGVGADRVHWVTTGPERLKSAGYPPGVDVTCADGKLPGELLADGTVDAVLVPKRGGRMIGDAAYETPFADVIAAQCDSFAATGVFPIMHFIVMRGSLAERSPSLAAALCAAFVAAKASAMADEAGLEDMEPPVWGEKVSASLPLFDGDAWPYGIDANRRTLEVIRESLVEQGLIRTPVKLDALFATNLKQTETAS